MNQVLKILACGAAAVCLCNAAKAEEPDKVIKTYSDIALATYQDALVMAEALNAAVDALIANPSQPTLHAARATWVAARAPYQQTEAFRFGNPIVDEWEGRVNSWPLDEGLIDYVDPSYGADQPGNELYTANIVANPTLQIGGQSVDTTAITPALLSETLQEAEGVESNVATGYHAIEFLLWGQDLNGTGAGAGKRPATDFDPANCTGGSCERRAAYLKAASSLLVSDLAEMVANWEQDGAARTALAQDARAGLAAILTGMGSLSYGELAGERMKLGLMLHDPEEEQDCFSDSTFNSHYFDQIGIRNVYTGHYRRIDGSIVSGPAIADMVEEVSPELDREIRGKLHATVLAMALMRARGESIEAYDQMIAEGNDEGNAVVQAAIDGLVDQTRSIERAVAALSLDEIQFEGSDSLDNPNAVFQ